ARLHARRDLTEGRETARIPRCHPHCLRLNDDQPETTFSAHRRLARITVGPPSQSTWRDIAPFGAQLSGVFSCMCGAGLPPSPALYGRFRNLLVHVVAFYF